MDPPSESRIDDLNTATLNFAAKPTMANGPNWYWHLVVKMSSNLADILLDLLADLPATSTDI